MPPVPSVFAPVAPILAAVPDVLAAVPHVLAAIADPAVVARVPAVLPPIADVLPAVAPIFPAIADVLGPVADAVTVDTVVGRGRRRQDGQRREERGGENEAGEADHGRFLLVGATGGVQWRAHSYDQPVHS